MDISIIIVNYNSGAFLFNCVNSIITNLSDIDYEILVVDNKSSDDSFDRCKAIMNNRLKLIQSNANLGFSKANNLGADRATGKILHFLNPDTHNMHLHLCIALRLHEPILSNLLQCREIFL